MLLLAAGPIGCTGTSESDAGGRSARVPKDRADQGAGESDQAPTVRQVTITPSVPKVDGSVKCAAETNDPDGDKLDVHYVWMNDTRGTVLGRSETLSLTPSAIMPGEALSCTVTAEDPDGVTGEATADVSPGCGYADARSLSDVSFTLHIVFRPWITDDVIPGWGGEPWDWDGDIPDWLIDVADVLSDVLDIVAAVCPDPRITGAAKAADAVETILGVIDEYGPELMEGDVPPDPDLYPYVFDSEGQLYSIASGSIQYDNTYEVSLRFSHLDLTQYAGVAVDMEDLDVAFDDNMGDYLDQDASPLQFAPDVFADGAYCTSMYYNPSDSARSSALAYVPGSVLFMAIEM